MVFAETVSLVLVGVGSIGIAAIKLGPIVKEAFSNSAAYTKKTHDEYCSMRLESIRQRLISIESHEKEAKEAMEKVWSRLDMISDRLADNHTALLREIVASRR